jgi:hypothetical protein
MGAAVLMDLGKLGKRYIPQLLKQLKRVTHPSRPTVLDRNQLFRQRERERRQAKWEEAASQHTTTPRSRFNRAKKADDDKPCPHDTIRGFGIGFPGN